MDPTILEKSFHGHPSNLTANWIETWKSNHFRRIINDNINPCQAFKGSNIAAFTSDNPSLHTVIRKMNRWIGLFSHIVTSNPLHSLNQDILGHLVRALFDILLRCPNTSRNLLGQLVLGLGQDNLTRFRLSQGCYPLKLSFFLLL